MAPDLRTFFIGRGPDMSQVNWQDWQSFVVPENSLSDFAQGYTPPSGSWSIYFNNSMDDNSVSQATIDIMIRSMPDPPMPPAIGAGREGHEAVVAALPAWPATWARHPNDVAPLHFRINISGGCTSILISQVESQPQR